jgi:predicted RNase H-like HicB family nuclease
VAGRSKNQYPKQKRKSQELPSKAGSRSHQKITEPKVNTNQYTYRIFYSPEDGEYVGTCTEFNSLSHLDSTPEKALKGIKILVSDVIEDLIINNEQIPSANIQTNNQNKLI